MKPLRNKLQPQRDLQQSIAQLYEELNRTNEAVNKTMGYGQTDRQGQTGDLRTLKNDTQETFNLQGKGDFGWYSSANDIFQPLGKGDQWLKRLRFDNRGYQGSLTYEVGWQSGRGWRIEETSGNLNSPNYAMYIDDLEVRNNLKVYELLIQQIRAHTGDLLFTPGGGKVKEIVTSTQYAEVITFEDPANAGTVPVAEGDYIFLKQVDIDKTTAVKTIGRVVRSISGDEVTLYKVDDNNDGTHDLSETGSIEVGDDFVSIGNVGATPSAPYSGAGITGSDDRQAMIQMSILGTYAPFIRVMDDLNEWQDLFSARTSVKAQIGNIRGLNDLSGTVINTDVYGAYFRNKLYIGEIGSGKGVLLSTEADAILESYVGAGTLKGFAVWDSSNPKMFLGDSAGAYADWNITTADTLTVTGGIVQSSGSGARVSLDTTACFTGALPGIKFYDAANFAYITTLSTNYADMYFGTDGTSDLTITMADFGSLTLENTNEFLVFSFDGSGNGLIEFGDKDVGGTRDVNLYRSAANILKTDDNLAVALRIYNQDIIYPKITEGGTDSNRTLTVQLSQLDGTTNVSTSGLITFWISTTADPQASDPGKSTYTLNNFSETTGRLISPTSFSYTALHHGITTTGGAFVITATGHASGAIRTLYFHCEIQGVVYTEEFTLRESSPA